MVDIGAATFNTKMKMYKSCALETIYNELVEKVIKIYKNQIDSNYNIERNRVALEAYMLHAGFDQLQMTQMAR